MKVDVLNVMKEDIELLIVKMVLEKEKEVIEKGYLFYNLDIIEVDQEINHHQNHMKEKDPDQIENIFL